MIACAGRDRSKRCACRWVDPPSPPTTTTATHICSRPTIKSSLRPDFLESTWVVEQPRSSWRASSSDAQRTTSCVSATSSTARSTRSRSEVRAPFPPRDRHRLTSDSPRRLSHMKAGTAGPLTPTLVDSEYSEATDAESGGGSIPGSAVPHGRLQDIRVCASRASVRQQLISISDRWPVPDSYSFVEVLCVELQKHAALRLEALGENAVSRTL